MGRHCVVTGAAGFLGSHLTDRLLARGDRVTAVDNELTGSWSNLAHQGENPDLVRIHADVSVELPVKEKPDFIFHFASPASPKDFDPLALEVMDVNSVGTRRCLDLAAETGASFFFASTSEVYGDPAVSPQPETYRGNVNPIGHRSVYDEAKRFGEAMTKAFERGKGVDVRIVRFFNTFGPRMRHDDGRVVPTFVMQALGGEPLTLHGDGSQTRSFGYCQDTVTGILKLADSGFTDPVNIGSEHEMTVKEFAELVIRLTDSTSEIIYVDAMPDDPKQRRPDLTRAREILGYEPQTSVEEGLRETIAYFRSLL